MRTWPNKFLCTVIHCIFSFFQFYNKYFLFWAELNRASGFSRFSQQHKHELKRAQLNLIEVRETSQQGCGGEKKIHEWQENNQTDFKCTWKPYKFPPPGDPTRALHLSSRITLSVTTELLHLNQTKRSFLAYKVKCDGCELSETVD